MLRLDKVVKPWKESAALNDHIKKPKANGASSKLPANQKPCDRMAEAIVMDGGKRGQVVKVCADPACRTHHPNTPSP
jgi:hypothetical protein